MAHRKGTPRRSAQTNSRPTTLSLLPARDMVPLPGLIIPVYITKGTNAESIRYALKKQQFVAVTMQTGADNEKPNRNNLCEYGAYAQIAHSVNLPNGDLRVRLHVQGRIEISSFICFTPFAKVRVKYLDEQRQLHLSAEQQRTIEEIKNQFAVLAKYDASMEELVYAAQDLFEPGVLADLVASALPLEALQGQKVLEELKPLKRLQLARGLLNTQLDLAAIKERVASQAEKELGRAHHEQLLRAQIRQIQVELGEAEEEDNELSQLKTKVKRLKMPAESKSEVLKQLRRLEQLHPDTSEAALARTYIDWILEIPWSARTKDRLDLGVAKKILDEDHFGLEKTKERILDYLGVLKLKRDAKGPILLLVGPPGVGKTSLGRSIARALGRKFVRVSVGGLRDEAELSGHRRTYVGALPGRVVQGLCTASTKNPVFVLDEVDKIGSDFRGDPASVLLEILDPEQNREFDDHYLNIPLDLSEVMFVCTANVTDTVPPALLDRMEIIEIAGYTTEEKLQIAKRYLVPRLKSENGLEKVDITVPDTTLLQLISGYTRESGVRELGRAIGTILRKVARSLAEGNKIQRRVSPKHIEGMLGPIKFVPDRQFKTDQIGVVTGLAWTSTGGEILPIEASITKGKGTLSLTGQMGEVMRESGMAALTYVLSNAAALGIDPSIYEHSAVHIHIPQGAIPKDGPSAGIAIATALVSIFAGTPVSRNVAMTGEITLRGNVLAIGGLKEKALAALRIGIPVVIIPKENERELVEFPSYLSDKVTFIPVSKVDEVLKVALAPPKELAIQDRLNIAPATKPSSRVRSHVQLKDVR